MRVYKKIRIVLATFLCIGILAGCGGQSAPSDQPSSRTVSIEGTDDAQTGGAEKMKIEIQAGGQTFTAVLSDSPSGRALAEQLPMSVTMRELNGNEKFYDLPEELPTDTKEISSIHAGDLMLYGPDCLVLFYKDFKTTYSYTKLGRVEDTAGLAEALGRGNVQVTFQ